MESEKEDILNRLKRIEGQIKGIQKMIDSDQGCTEVLVQVAAARAAINKVGGLILENYSRSCIKKAAMENKDEEQIDQLIDTIIKYTK